ncbi:MAG: exopolysaccharide biosynthesis protein [Solirubrobacterales bacterium]
MSAQPSAEQERLSDRLEGWLEGDQPKTLGNLTALFDEKSFAILFVLLLAVPALPIPTGGVTHAFEVIAALLALELIAGRRQIWLPERFKRRELGPAATKRFSDVLLKRIRWLERHSRPRLASLLDYRIAGVLYGIAVLILTAVAFIAPPFTGLDTLPSLGVVLISLAVLLEDAVLALVGLALGVLGIVLVIALGTAVAKGLSSLL